MFVGHDCGVSRRSEASFECDVGEIGCRKLFRSKGVEVFGGVNANGSHVGTLDGKDWSSCKMIEGERQASKRMFRGLNVKYLALRCRERFRLESGGLLLSGHSLKLDFGFFWII